MKKILFLTKTLLAVALLCVGQNAWGDNANLTPTADTFFKMNNDDTKAECHGTDVALYTGAWSNMWTNGTPGIKVMNNQNSSVAFFKFDVSDYKGKVTSAVFKITATNSNGSNRSIYLGYSDLTTWDETTTGAESGLITRGTGLNIHPFNSTTDVYSISINANSTQEVSFSSTALLDYLNNDEDGIISLIIYGMPVECYINSKEATTGKPSLALTYTNETLYTATFTANSGAITPTVTIYSDAERETPVSNGTLADKTTYYYRAVLAGYDNYEGSFTVDGENPSVNFTMTAKTPVASLTVNYKYGDDIVYTDNQSVTGLYVGESLNVPFRMYVMNGDALYQVAARATNPWYGEPTTLTENTVVEKSVTPVDLGGGKVVLFEDLDNTDAQNAGDRASYCSAYDNRAYTSAEVLPAGTYTFYLKLQNKGRTSKIKIGETEICAASDYNKDSWSNVTLTDVNVPSAGNLTIAAGGSSTRDDYDVIIAVLKSVPATIGSNGFTTFASPYPLDLANLPNGLEAYTATLAGTTLSFTKKATEVAAGTGLLLKGANNTAYNIPVAVSGSNVEGNALIGVTNSTTSLQSVENGIYYFVMKKAASASDALSFAPISTSTAVTMPSGKAYVELPAENNARALRISFGDITGVDNVEASAEAQAQDGKFIENGKLVIVKNGVKYNAAGQQVK